MNTNHEKDLAMKNEHQQFASLETIRRLESKIEAMEAHQDEILARLIAVEARLSPMSPTVHETPGLVACR